MADTVNEEEVAGAQAYEDLHVPALFQLWAPRVCDAAAIGDGQRVLDVACGTGVVSREARQRVGANGAVHGLDAGQGMLEVAASLSPDVEFHHGLAGELPFEDATFDAVVCQFGLMFFPDRVAAVQEMLRVLKPGGRLAVAVWDHLDETEAYPDEVEMLQRLAGQAAADALRAPFVIGHIDELRSIFVDAGADDISIDTQDGLAVFPNVRVMIEADVRGWLPVMGVFLDEETIATILDEAESVLGRFVSDDGTVRFNSPAHIVSASRV
jgi:SAM-dependent methyltransferase